MPRWIAIECIKEIQHEASGVILAIVQRYNGPPRSAITESRNYVFMLFLEVVIPPSLTAKDVMSAYMAVYTASLARQECIEEIQHQASKVILAVVQCYNGLPRSEIIEP